MPDSLDFKEQNKGFSNLHDFHENVINPLIDRVDELSNGNTIKDLHLVGRANQDANDRRFEFLSQEIGVLKSNNEILKKEIEILRDQVANSLKNLNEEIIKVKNSL